MIQMHMLLGEYASILYIIDNIIIVSSSFQSIIISALIFVVVEITYSKQNIILLFYVYTYF